MIFCKVLKKTAGVMAVALTVTMVTPTVLPQTATVEASGIRLSKKKIVIKVGQSTTLKVKGTKAKVKWSSNNRKIAKVTSKGKVTGKKTGSAKIIAKVKGKKLVCKVTVKRKKKIPVETEKATQIPKRSKVPNPTEIPTRTVEPNSTKTPTRTVEPNSTEIPTRTVEPNSTEIPTRTVEPNSTERPNPTVAPNSTKIPTRTVEPNLTEIPTRTVEPNSTETPTRTVAPNPTEIPKPVSSLSPTVPVVTETPKKQVDLALKFYLAPFDPERPNQQFVRIYLENYMNESVFVETDAYMTTNGINYPAMISDSKEGDKQEIKTMEDDGLQSILYDSKEYVMGNLTDNTLWLKSAEDSTFTFFFWVGNQRYHATINYEEGGAVFTEAGKEEILEPIGTMTPGTIAPEPTKEPEQTPEPAKPTVTETPKKQVDLALKFYLAPFDPERPNQQFVRIYLENYMNESVFVETDAYMTTNGINYPAMISDSKEGDKQEIKTMEDDGLQSILYDSKEYVMGNLTDNTLWLKSAEDSTFTFFFWVGNQRYHATINYEEGGAVFTEAGEEEILEPIGTMTPGTIAPEPTKEPEQTPEPSEAPQQTSTPEPEEPTVTETPKKQVDLALKFYLAPFDPERPNQQFVRIYLENYMNESVFVETDAYMTTNGINYPAMISDSKEGDKQEIKTMEDDGLQSILYDSKEYVMGNLTDNTLWLKSAEDSTFTFFFWVGNQRYHATINYEEGGAVFTEAGEGDRLEPIQTMISETNE